MFSKIKNYFLHKYLSENKVNRQKKLLALQEARSIGMICEITDEDSYKNIFAIFTKLQENDRNVRLIGYVNDKEVPFYCLPQLTCDYFSNAHLNWYGKPVMEQILDFTKIEFDLLIDFNYRYNPAVESIVSMTRAKFVVGQTKECQHLYDLFIDSKNKDYRKFLEAIYTYTNKLTGNDR